MIVIRRVVAVLLGLVLVGAFCATLLAQRVNATLLSTGFLSDQLAAIGVYDAVHDEVLPRALDDFLTEQDEKIPDNLEGIALPTDEASQRVVLDFARAAVPPEFLAGLADEGIAGFVGYLTGEREELAINVSLHEPVRMAFLSSTSGEPSEFERAWTELELGSTAFAGLARSIEIPELELLEHWQSMPVLARLRAEGVPLEEAVGLVSAIYEVEPASPEIERLTAAALDRDASLADRASLETLIVTTRFVSSEGAARLVDAVGKGRSPQDDLLTVLLGGEREAALAWFEGELFEAVRRLAAYFSGEASYFVVHIDFSPYPELATLAARSLNTTPEALVREGYRLSDVEINRELAAGDDPPVENLEDARTLFSPAGRTFSFDELLAGEDDESVGGGAVAAAAAAGGTVSEEPAREPLTPDRIRPFTRAFHDWAVPVGAAGVLLLAGLIGVLGGRAWWSRAVWAAASVAAPSLLIAGVAGPVYAAVAAPTLERAIETRQSELLADAGPSTTLGLRALDQLEVVIDGQAATLATSGAVVAGLALLAVAVAVGARIYLGRWRARTEVVESLAIPMNVDELATPPDEARAA
jgi:hypothetical protein